MMITFYQFFNESHYVKGIDSKDIIRQIFKKSEHSYDHGSIFDEYRKIMKMVKEKYRYFDNVNLDAEYKDYLLGTITIDNPYPNKGIHKDLIVKDKISIHVGAILFDSKALSIYNMRSTPGFFFYSGRNVNYPVIKININFMMRMRNPYDYATFSNVIHEITHVIDPDPSKTKKPPYNHLTGDELLKAHASHKPEIKAEINRYIAKLTSKGIKKEQVNNMLRKPDNEFYSDILRILSSGDDRFFHKDDLETVNQRRKQYLDVWKSDPIITRQFRRALWSYFN